MKFFLVAVKTRDDIEPFLVLVKKLGAQGHEAACCFPEQFAHLVEEEGAHFFPWVRNKRRYKHCSPYASPSYIYRKFVSA